MTELNSKVVFITGASRGVGFATAQAFHHAGVRDFALHYNSHEEGVQKLAGELRTGGATVHLLQADLSDESGIERLCAAVSKLPKPADILINNAGSLVQRAKLAEFTPALFDRVINLNVKSAYFLAQAVASEMSKKGSGHIVNLSSIAARNGGGVGATIYAAAKAAVAAITKRSGKRTCATRDTG